MSFSEAFGHIDCKLFNKGTAQANHFGKPLQFETCFPTHRNRAKKLSKRAI